MRVLVDTCIAGQVIGKHEPFGCPYIRSQEPSLKVAGVDPTSIGRIKKKVINIWV